jgi:hypothetical protein
VSIVEAGSPMRDYPDREIAGSLDSFGGWLAWLHDDDGTAAAALRWKIEIGDPIPDELVELRDLLVSFGKPPIDEAIDRVNGLERAFAEVQELMRGLSGNATQVERIRQIVRDCVKYSGAFQRARGQ